MTADEQAPLYLAYHGGDAGRSLHYLGAEKAEEVVITNTNKISDMCETICHRCVRISARRSSQIRIRR